MRRNILIVDDDRTIRQLLNVFLEQSGFDIRSAEDGYSAWDELNNNPFDLVILDISMPHMGGLQLLKNLRASENLSDLPVLMLTSSTNKSDVVKAKEMGATDYMVKPPTKDELIGRVERILGGRPQFQEVSFSADSEQAQGRFAMDLRIKSISRNGMTLIGPVAMDKGQELNEVELSLLQNLGVQQKSFKVSQCTPDESDHFFYYISFLGMDKKDHEKIVEWIMAETFSRKAKAKSVS